MKVERHPEGFFVFVGDFGGWQADVFFLEEYHLKLIQRLCIFPYCGEKRDWGYPVPAVGFNRPFGNSDVIGDVAEIVGVEPEGDPIDDEYQVFSEAQEKYLLGLIAEVTTALLVCTSNLSFQPGVYARQGAWDDWRLIAEPHATTLREVVRT
ncbi:MAG: hypothetical protein JW934_08055 [Anaerolineae bacterium]|nr:hypothetical protein [Anaerolineae bacterium]